MEEQDPIGWDVSLDTNTSVKIGLDRREGGYLRLYVLTSDLLRSVEFVHVGKDDPDRSIEFLRSLSRQADRMAEGLCSHYNRGRLLGKNS
ncbi:MAG TPA: hypothetical protein VF444_19565 [Pseudonocardiaceae bacterium]